MQTFTLEEAKKVIENAKEDVDKLKEIGAVEFGKKSLNLLQGLTSLPGLVADLSKQLTSELMTVGNFLKAAYE